MPRSPTLLSPARSGARRDGAQKVLSNGAFLPAGFLWESERPHLSTTAYGALQHIDEELDALQCVSPRARDGS